MKLCDFDASLDKPLFLIAGPCVIESEQLALDTAGYLKELCLELKIPFIYNLDFSCLFLSYFAFEITLDFF